MFNTELVAALELGNMLDVAEALSHFPGLELVNVYGVQVPGQDGRAGMAALLFAPGQSFDGARFWRHVDEALPRYAAPLFVRVLPEMEMTGTFKLRKVSLQEDGFDPARVSDPLFFRDDVFVPGGRTSEAPVPIERSPAWIATSAVVALTAVAVLGPGLGAGYADPHPLDLGR